MADLRGTSGVRRGPDQTGQRHALRFTDRSRWMESGFKGSPISSSSSKVGNTVVRFNIETKLDLERRI